MDQASRIRKSFAANMLIALYVMQTFNLSDEDIEKSFQQVLSALMTNYQYLHPEVDFDQSKYNHLLEFRNYIFGALEEFYPDINQREHFEEVDYYDALNFLIECKANSDTNFAYYCSKPLGVSANYCDSLVPNEEKSVSLISKFATSLRLISEEIDFYDKGNDHKPLNPVKISTKHSGQSRVLTGDTTDKAVKAINQKKQRNQYIFFFICVLLAAGAAGALYSIFTIF